MHPFVLLPSACSLFRFARGWRRPGRRHCIPSTVNAVSLYAVQLLLFTPHLFFNGVDTRMTRASLGLTILVSLRDARPVAQCRPLFEPHEPFVDRVAQPQRPGHAPEMVGPVLGSRRVLCWWHSTTRRWGRAMPSWLRCIVQGGNVRLPQALGLGGEKLAGLLADVGLLLSLAFLTALGFGS